MNTDLTSSDADIKGTVLEIPELWALQPEERVRYNVVVSFLSFFTHTTILFGHVPVPSDDDGRDPRSRSLDLFSTPGFIC